MYKRQEQAFAAARGDSTVSADDDAALALGSALREVTLLHRRFVAIARRLHDDTHQSTRIGCLH